jgi:hypothetical protein
MQQELLQIPKLTDPNWNRTCGQNIGIKEVVDWFTTLFDGAILLQCDLIKIKKHWPVSLLSSRHRIARFFNLAISEGIGPIEIQVKKPKKMDGELVSHIYLTGQSH